MTTLVRNYSFFFVLYCVSTVQLKQHQVTLEFLAPVKINYQDLLNFEIADSTEGKFK